MPLQFLAAFQLAPLCSCPLCFNSFTGSWKIIMKWVHIARYCLRRCRVSLKSQSFNHRIFPNRQQRFIMASSLLCGGHAANYFMNNKFPEKNILLTSLSESSSCDNNKCKSLKANFCSRCSGNNGTSSCTCRSSDKTWLSSFWKDSW